MIEIANMIDCDVTVSKIATKFNYNLRSMYLIVNRYKSHGIEEIFHKSDNSNFSIEFKLDIILEKTRIH